MNSPGAGGTIYERYAIYIRPLITRHDDNLWRAHYPEVDWYVTADSEEAAGEQIHREALRRLDAGEPDAQPPFDILERHLANPIPGVYAMDAELFGYLRGLDQASDSTAPYARVTSASLDLAFEEAERRRALGQTYTKADYLAEHPHS
jgi:hypothetical protein